MNKDGKCIDCGCDIGFGENCEEDQCLECYEEDNRCGDKSGKQAEYREDDWKALVEIVEDQCDDEWIKYKLKVIETLHKSRMYKPVEDGHIFEVTCRKDFCSAMIGWHLDIYGI